MMSSLLYSTVCLLLVVVSEAVDPRLLRGQPTPATDVAELARQYQSLLSQFNVLATDLRNAKVTIEELQQRDDHHARTLSAIEDRLGNACSCEGRGPGAGNPNEGDQERRDLDGWVSSLSRDKIRNIRDNFTHPGGGNSGRNREDEEASVVMMGRAFASLMTKQVIENRRNNPVNRQTTAVPVIEDPVRRPRPRPGGFPFDIARLGRSIAQRHRREITEDQVFTEMEETFTDLVRSNKKCAFSAVRTTPLFGHKSPQVVTFEKTQANKGKSFDPESGVFVATIPGIYYFSYTMRTYDHKHIGVALMLNDDPVVAMTTDASDRKVMQTQSAMLHLEIGDQVWLLLGPSEHFALYGNDFNYNTYNGLLLYPNYIK